MSFIPCWKCISAIIEAYERSETSGGFLVSRTSLQLVLLSLRYLREFCIICFAANLSPLLAKLAENCCVVGVKPRPELLALSTGWSNVRMCEAGSLSNESGDFFLSDLLSAAGCGDSYLAEIVMDMSSS
jgi:hypothetical protein